MKYAIYGVNRVAKDFLYIFSELQIVCFFDESYSGKFIDYHVYKDDKLVDLRGEFDQLIICGLDKSFMIAKAEKCGYKRGKDYCIEEEFFEKLDVEQYNPNDRPIAVWGMGRRYASLIKWNQELKISVLFDSYRYGGQYNGLDVLDPNDNIDLKDYFIIVAVAKNEGILENLESQGLKYGIDYCTDTDWKNRPSELLKRTVFDNHQYDLDCRTMLNHLEVGAGGDICMLLYYIYLSFYRKSCERFHRWYLVICYP